MLERQKLLDLTFDILNTAMDTEIGVYKMCDENFDALSLNSDSPAFDKDSTRIKAINIKCLRQDSQNMSSAGNGLLMEDTITLQIIIFYASNHTNWGETINQMCEAVQWTLEYGKDERFRKFGNCIRSRSTQIDDGTGYTSKVREGGAIIEYQIETRELPDEQWRPKLDKFMKLANTFAMGNAELAQTTNLPGPWPEDDSDETDDTEEPETENPSESGPEENN